MAVVPGLVRFRGILDVDAIGLSARRTRRAHRRQGRRSSGGRGARGRAAWRGASVAASSGEAQAAPPARSRARPSKPAGVSAPRACRSGNVRPKRRWIRSRSSIRARLSSPDRPPGCCPSSPVDGGRGAVRRRRPQSAGAGLRPPETPRMGWFDARAARGGWPSWCKPNAPMRAIVQVVRESPDRGARRRVVAGAPRAIAWERQPSQGG